MFLKKATVVENKDKLSLCSGKNLFFWLPRDGNSKFHSKVLDYRIKPCDRLFNNPFLICIECKSQSTTNKEMEGSIAMIYHSKDWKLMIIKKITDEEIVAYSFFRRERKCKVFAMKRRNYILKFVSLFVSDHVWFKKQIYNKEYFCNLASINSKDGYLDAGISPTSIWLESIMSNKTANDNNEKKGLVQSTKLRYLPRNIKGEKRKHEINLRTKSRMNFKKGKMSKEWLTVYIPDHNPFGNLSTSSKEQLILVPEIGSETGKSGSPFKKMVFHAIPRSKLHNLSTVLIPEQVKLLRRLSKRKFQFIKFDHDQYPVRFSVLNNDEFTALEKNGGGLNYYKDSSQPFLWNFSNESSCNIPGIVVSMWDSLDSVKEYFPLSHYKRMQDRVGNGFGDRSSVPSGALNVYFGPNGSDRPLPTPIYGPNIRKQADYHRSYYHHDEFHHQLIRRINKGNSILLNHAMAVDPYMELVGASNYARKIWTQGISSRKVTYLNQDGNLKTKRLITGPHSGIGFYCKLHYDPNDKLSYKETDELMCKIDNSMDYATKISEIKNSIGLGYPTTIGYNIYNPQKDVDILAHFVSWGFVTSINDKSFHHFYAWSFPHCSTFPYYIKKWLALATNEGMNRNHCVYIGAFGINGRKIK